MSQTDQNRFQIFFKEEKYLILKNHLYNYFLRKRAVRKCLQQDDLEIVLEVGSGISPILTGFSPTFFSDLSYDALKTLKGNMGKRGYYVVANAGFLPFKSSVFSHAICSEVLEHIQDDVPAIKELSRTLKKPSGSLIITVPHRNCYFTNDDRFVNHYRRYELHEIKERLKSSGLRPVYLQKVLGPLEKVTMSFVVFLFSAIQKHQPQEAPVRQIGDFRLINSFAFLFKWINIFFRGFFWLDAMIMPRSLSTVILIKSVVSQNKP